MADMPDQHANYLVAFHDRLTTGGLDSELAAALTIDLNKALLTGTASLPEPTKADRRQQLEEAAEAKRLQREIRR